MVTLVIRSLDGEVLSPSETWAAASNIDEVVQDLCARGKLACGTQVINGEHVLGGCELLAELANCHHPLELTAVAMQINLAIAPDEIEVPHDLYQPYTVTIRPGKRIDLDEGNRRVKQLTGTGVFNRIKNAAPDLLAKHDAERERLQDFLCGRADALLFGWHCQQPGCWTDRGFRAYVSAHIVACFQRYDWQGDDPYSIISDFDPGVSWKDWVPDEQDDDDDAEASAPPSDDDNAQFENEDGYMVPTLSLRHED